MGCIVGRSGWLGASAEPPPRKIPQRRTPKLESVAPLVDAMLREDLTAPRKQQQTARRVLARLVDEHGAGVRAAAAE
jgi:hypothetical protein